TARSGEAGAGAAGGLGYALLAIGATLQSGAATVCDAIGLDDQLAGAHWLITGEGRSDAQTLQGKAPFVAAKRALAAGVSSSLLSGALDVQALPALNLHFKGCFSIVLGPATLAAAIDNAAGLTQASAAQIAALWAAARGAGKA
ncbi:MAG: glycerate kinase, partial [Janthinobacterium lividum]